MIFLSGVETISFDDLVHGFMALLAIWGMYKIIMEIVSAITTRHDKEKKWSEMEEKLTRNIQEERDKIYQNYDRRLDELESRIDENHADTVAKTQEIKAELYVLTNAMLGVLDGLIEQGCNGVVKAARSELSAYINERAHD